MKILFRNAFLSSLLVTAACELPVDDEPGAAADDGEVGALLSVGPTLLSNTTPTGLYLTPSTLYWTSLDLDQDGPDHALVWGAAKNNLPGNEALVHSMAFDVNDVSYRAFGGVVEPGVAGPTFVYFVYNYIDDGFAGSYIMKKAVGGTSATTIGASDYVGDGDLVTDGVNLFWSDSSFIYRISTDGGVQTALVQDASPHLVRDGAYLYYVDGLLIRRIPKAGGTRQLVATASNPVTALHVQAGTLYWGEQGGAVRSQAVTGGTVTTYQAPIAGRTVTSIGFDTARVMWIDCLTASGTSCAIKTFWNGVTTVASSGVDHADHLRWDAATMYWGQDGGLMSYTHWTDPPPPSRPCHRRGRLP